MPGGRRKGHPPLDPISGQLTLAFTQGNSSEYLGAVRHLGLEEGIGDDVPLTGPLTASTQEDEVLPQQATKASISDVVSWLEAPQRSE